MKLILPVLIAVSAPTALAALSAHIEVGNMHVEVRDLTPDDDIAARHEVFGIVGSYASVQVKQDGGSETAHVLDQRSVSFRLDKPWGWGYSEVTATPDQFRVVAEGMAGQSGSVLGGVNVHTFGQVAHLLGPYTAVTVTSDYLLEMHADKVLGASRDEVVSGYLYSFLDTFEAAAYANPAFGPNDVRLSGQLSATFLNDSNRVVVVNHLFASEFDARPAALIPEPATGGLFAAGLGLLGLWTLRRSRFPAAATGASGPSTQGAMLAIAGGRNGHLIVDLAAGATAARPPFLPRCEVLARPRRAARAVAAPGRPSAPAASTCSGW